MNRDEFQAQLDQAIPPGVQRALHIEITDSPGEPQAVFPVGSETWRLTFAASREHWQLHAPGTGVPLWFLTEELLGSLMVLRTYRISQLDHAARTTIAAQLTSVLTLRGEAGQELRLSPQAALELLDLLTVSQPALKQLIRGARE